MPREFRVGEWLVQPQRNLITNPDQQVKLEPRGMEVLVYLAEHADEVVSKEQLVESVWQGAFVTDKALTYAIHELRKALGDDAKDQTLDWMSDRRRWTTADTMISELRIL